MHGLCVVTGLPNSVSWSPLVSDFVTVEYMVLVTKILSFWRLCNKHHLDTIALSSRPTWGARVQ